MDFTQLLHQEISLITSMIKYSDSEYRLLFPIFTTDSYLLNATNEEHPLSQRKALDEKGVVMGWQKGAQKLWTSVFVYPQFIIL